MSSWTNMLIFVSFQVLSRLATPVERLKFDGCAAIRWICRGKPLKRSHSFCAQTQRLEGNVLWGPLSKE